MTEASAIVEGIRLSLDRLQVQPDIDARDRRSLFIIRDMLSNLSPERALQSEALDELIAFTQEFEDDTKETP